MNGQKMILITKLYNIFINILDIAGKQIANPLASIWSVSQMLDFFGYENWGARLIDAIEALMVEGKTLTCDLGGVATTREVGDAIIRLLSADRQ